MREIVVISGKGGTGKTSLVGAFAALAGDAVLADCDVDAADLHLILKPDVHRTETFSGGKVARIEADKCVGCGRCEEVCRFDAVTHDGPANAFGVGTYRVDGIGCEGCGVCSHFCPAGAIEFTPAVNGRWFVSQTRFGPMVHARLTPGQENSGKLVTLIRKEARALADRDQREFLLVDGSPGIGCPVIASITGADFVLVVTEPTLSGQHDLDRVLDLAERFGIPTAICINKFDINPRVAERIEEAAGRRNVPVFGRIPYDTTVTQAQVAGVSVVEHSHGPLQRQIESLWQAVAARAGSLSGKGS
jgi:MinD superfamily P-loop ATPase